MSQRDAKAVEAGREAVLRAGAEGPVPRREWLIFAVILAVAVGVRLMGIGQPFVDAWAWRESDVGMIAENFYRGGMNLFYPSVNWGGAGPGYVGTEFPALPWVAAWLYVPLGVQDWIGRVLCVMAFAAGMPALFLVARRVTGSGATALAAAALYGAMPLSVFAARSFMPDTPALTFALWGMVLFARWAKSPGRMGTYAGALVCTALALLVKIPMLVFAPVLLALAAPARGWGIFRMPFAWVFLVLALAPSVLWYRHGMQIGRTYFPHHFFGEEGIQTVTLGFYGKVAGVAVFSSFTPLLSVAAAAGLAIAVRRRMWPLVVWLGMMLAFLVVAGHGNRHAWYQLPTAALVAILAAVALVAAGERLMRAGVARGVVAGLGAAFFAGVAGLSTWALAPLYRPAYEDVRRAGEAVQRLTPADALVVACVPGSEPVIFYHQRRRGWFLPTYAHTGLGAGWPVDGAAAVAEVERRRAQGATHLLLTQYALGWLETYPELRTYLLARGKAVDVTPTHALYALQ